ncbi:Ribulose-5-phosphate 4-epimerase/Fuculose-1-phosphate aldolase [Loktanella fryxellensis]|uniref:3-oxo-tetronate 4-phosphate decarboxylase n=1 Tax=Loktanella fryxellensis TaxID=245187 RepID=A0A1H8KEE4_9RHOB|nr:aldolase [Loktanella fryxellensis]SEN91137.1 Ribulose-5-phosphate 4-epimerase/Fuculose-1-phosphate aldolase [Loktanella fryxellensis]
MSDALNADLLCTLCQSLFRRGYSVGGAGNVSVRLDNGGFLVTPTGGSLGRLTPDDLARIDTSGNPVPGPKPSKEFAFHRALFDCRPDAGAIVHLHSTYLTALSCLEDLSHENAMRPFTPYYVMRVGYLPVIPYYRPGAMEIARDLVIAANAHSVNAFLLASHGVVVLGKNIEEAVNNAEELEETARLAFILREEKIRYLTETEISDLSRS